MKTRISIFIIIIVFLGSCIPHRKLVTFDTNRYTYDSTQVNIENREYKVISGDILSIKVASTDPNSVSIFNKSTGATTQGVGEIQNYVNGYIINKDGNINLPFIGFQAVNGLTIKQIQDTVQLKINNYYKYAIVEVKLLSYKVTVLGEVKNPGTFTFYQDYVTLSQVLAVAGDLTTFGNRYKIKIIRKSTTGQTTIHNINISNPNFINHFNYYIYPYDIIYIEPLKEKAFNVNIPYVSLFITSVTFLLLMINTLNKK